MHAKNRCIKTISIVPVIFIAGLFLFEWYVYNFVFVQKGFGRSDEALGPAYLIAAFGGAVFNAMWLLAFWSFLRCSFTDPGVVHAEPEAEAADRPHPGRGWQPGISTMCKHCKHDRPERSHHCRICGRCVMRMDHHCPWVGNCVGFNNHKYFILMTFYGFLACMTFVITGFPVLKQLFLGRRPSFLRNSLYVDIMMLSIGGLLSASFGMSLMMLLVAHTWLLLRNLTSVEVAYSGKNPYCTSAWQNAQQIFGAPDLTWFLPVPPAKPMLDGNWYPTQLPEIMLSSIVGAREAARGDDGGV